MKTSLNNAIVSFFGCLMLTSAFVLILETTGIINLSFLDETKKTSSLFLTAGLLGSAAVLITHENVKI